MKVPALRSLVLHPIFFAIFPALFLWAHNVEEASIEQAALPLALSALAAVLVWLLLFLLMKDNKKAALATSLSIFLFFSYGRFIDVLELLQVAVPGHGILLAGLVVLCVHVIVFVRRTRRNLATFTVLLNVVAVALVLMNSLPIVTHAFGGATGAGPRDFEVDADVTSAVGKSDLLPDIYLIILDEYASPATMIDYYDSYQNWFTDWLTVQGFFVACESQGVHPNTGWAIASTLNMERMDHYTADEVYESITHNKVATLLSSMGYRYVYCGNFYEIGKYDVGSDVYFNAYCRGGTTLATDFSRMLWNTSALSPFYDHIIGTSYSNFYRKALLETLDFLQGAPGIEGPKFVMAHIECPHDPFVFGANGEPTSPTDWYNYEDKRFYLGQYAFITEQMRYLLEVLLSDSAIEPIIVVQSDHGLRAGAERKLDLPRDEWLRILNAYYLPGYDGPSIDNAISPLNSFRLIFNHYFGTDYAMLEE